MGRFSSWGMAMRIALASIVVIVGVILGNSIISSFSEMTNERNDQLCQIDSSYCQWISKWRGGDLIRSGKTIPTSILIRSLEVLWSLDHHPNQSYYPNYQSLLMNTSIRFWTPQDQKCRYMSFPTYALAVQMIEEFMKIGVKAEVKLY